METSNTGLDMVSTDIANNFVCCSESGQLMSYKEKDFLFAIYSRILADAILTGSVDYTPQWLPTNLSTKILQVLMWLAARFAEWSWIINH